jgi:menaquinone-dependent protoporphyrinogen oxidase
MSSKILVAYATAGGSTAGVAEAIGQALTECGAQVDVRPMREVQDLTPYRAVVAGSAIQEGKWLPDAMRWMQMHRSTLAQKPFAAFLVCMTMAARNESYRKYVPTWMEPVRVLVRPVSEGYFAGSLDLAKVPSLKTRLGFLISVKLGVWATGDHRDWDVIRTWARALAPKL